MKNPIPKLINWYNKPIQLKIKISKSTFIILILILLLILTNLPKAGASSINKSTVSTNIGTATSKVPKAFAGGFSISDDMFIHAIAQRDAKIAHQKAVERARIVAKQRAAIKTAQASVNVVQPVYHAPINHFSGSLATWLYKLRMCESGGNYSINTGNGYYGAYQFSAATWAHWNTGYAYANLAPPAVQDATIIKNTLSTAGLSTQNPGCYASQGLSNYPPV